MSKNRLLKLLLVLVMGIAVICGISLSAGCKTDPVSYTVTFDSDGGSAVQSAEVESGKTVAKPTDPTKEGCVFNGWYLGCELYDFDTPVTGDLTLVASWGTPILPLYYTVTFDSDGGSAVQSAEVESDKTVAKPADPTKDGYTFGGWYLGEELFDFATAVTQNITLTAKWTENTVTPATEHTVTFDCDGGKITDREGTFELRQAVVESGTAVEVPDDPVKAGYDFAGWYTADDNEYDFSTAVTEDITLTAKWTPKASFTVTFDTLGGSEVSQQVVLNGEKVIEPNTNPTKSGYEFLGWCIDEECKTAYDFDSAVRNDITLYAKWAAV